MPFPVSAACRQTCFLGGTSGLHLVGKCECHIQVQARPTGSRAVTPQQRRPALARHGLNPWFQGCCHCRCQVFPPCVYDPQCPAGCAQGACGSWGIMKRHRSCMAAHVVRLHKRSKFLCLLDSATMSRPCSWFSSVTRITSAGELQHNVYMPCAQSIQHQRTCL